MTKYLDDVLSPLLCGFRKGYNSQYALLRILEKWRIQLENKSIIGALACDLSKAFDTLPHDLIIAKMEAYGFGYCALKLVYDYLCNRFQRCKVGSKYSKWHEVNIGVPQGSVLGPLLFNIFINDIFLFAEDVEICNFADDTSLSVHGKSLQTVYNNLKYNLQIILEWLKCNSLVPNPNKFQMMFLGTRSKANLTLEINGSNICSSDSITLLGIDIDWKLTFNQHVKNICKRASSKTIAITRLRNYLSHDQKLLLFNSFIMSCFGYCSLIWMFHGKTSNVLINSIHKRALRALYNDYLSDYDTLLSYDHLLNIHHININLLLVEVYKCLNKKTPSFLWDCFKYKQSNYNLRVSNRLILPKATTQTSLHSFTYRGCAAWNKLPDNLKYSDSSSILKSKLKSLKIADACSCKMCT